MCEGEKKYVRDEARATRNVNIIPDSESPNIETHPCLRKDNGNVPVFLKLHMSLTIKYVDFITLVLYYIYTHCHLPLRLFAFSPLLQVT